MKTFVLIKRVLGNGHTGQFVFEWWEKGDIHPKYKAVTLYNEAGGWNTLMESDVILETVKAKNWDMLLTKENIAKTTTYQKLLKDSTDKEIKIGWLAPDGKMHYCHYTNHILYADVVLNTDVPTLESKGWLHIYSGMNGLSPEKRMTQAQAYTAREELGLNVRDEDVLSA